MSGDVKLYGGIWMLQVRWLVDIAESLILGSRWLAEHNFVV